MIFVSAGAAVLSFLRTHNMSVYQCAKESISCSGPYKNGQMWVTFFLQKR